MLFTLAFCRRLYPGVLPAVVPWRFAGGCTLVFASGFPRRLPEVLPAPSSPDGGGLWFLYPHRLSPGRTNGGLWLFYPHRLSPDSGGPWFTLTLTYE